MAKRERKFWRIMINFCRVTVGVLFIFSGLVKANDPLGLAFKMQEFFDVWSQSSLLTTLMHGLDNYALPFSIIMITLEIVVGIALLIGWNAKFISWLLLLLIIFFTFLTGYAVLSGKIRTCGCFGDCIPLTAPQSFIKDLFLTVLIVLLAIGSSYIRPLIKPLYGFIVLMLSLILIILIQWYVLRHMPFKDCLPFKRGNNILALRKMPADAIPDKVDFLFVYEKNGKRKEFGKDMLPDSTWTFLKRQDIILQKGRNNEPIIKDFYLNTLSGADTTEALLNTGNYFYLFFVKDIKTDTSRCISAFSKVYGIARSNKRDIYVIATQASEVNDLLNNKHNFNVPVFSCDATALKTASRTDPSVYLMKGPVVENKWGWADILSGMK